MGCCRGFNARLLFLMACAMIEYVAHTVVLVLAPMIAMHFYPQTPFRRLGFYTALLAGAGYLGHVLSCRLWINVARSLQSSKGVVLWGLAITGAGFFSLLLCQSLLAMTLVRFATGLFSGVLPVALIEIDTICGNRQSRLAASTKYLGIGLGAVATFLLVALGHKLAQADPHSDTDAFLYFYPLAFVSVVSWIAAVVTLVGLRVQSRASYLQLAGDDDDDGDAHFVQQSRSALDDSPVAAAAARPMELVRSAFEETFRLHNRGGGAATTTQQLLAAPRPHYRAIRSIIPHYFHGFTADGHVVAWDFVGQLKLDKLHASGFTTADIRDHYRFFLAFAVEKLLTLPAQKIVYVIDLEGLTLTDADERVVEMASAVIEDVHKTFPDRLKALAVLNAPVWFSQVMAKLKAHIPSKKTADKIAFFRKETATHDLLALIGVDSLPTRYGGRNGVEIGKASQERALDELLKKTTGSLEETIEIVGRGNQIRMRTGSARAGGDDDGSDDEAFFDSLEYGLQDPFEDDDNDDEISIVVHSQASTNATAAVARLTGAAPPRPKAASFASSATSPAAEKKVHNVEGANVLKLDHRPASAAADPEVAITREPHAVLILSFYFFWLLVQLSFDELFPLWVFKDEHSVAAGSDSGTGAARLGLEGAHTERAAVAARTLTLAGSLALVALSVLLVQTLFSTLSSNVMTPLATLRVGLLFQIPVVGCFPLIDLFKLDALSFSWALVVAVLAAKHLMGAVAMHGLLTLLDNSIAVDRRLAVHRATQAVGYGAMLLGSAVAPALFALLGYFAKGFPFNHSLLYFVQALGLVFLLLFSFAIPSRMNFPQLFAMGKR
ncbi:hypothetical protein PybrP1_010205 [[Pythium] brassicae (nom. inval.)]|nr:hypothetical protein PybrP1_010205 [[Pythium] brassicae (nom. inval.)]